MDKKILWQIVSPQNQLNSYYNATNIVSNLSYPILLYNQVIIKKLFKPQLLKSMNILF